MLRKYTFILGLLSSLVLYAHSGNQYEHVHLLKDMSANEKAAILVVHFGTTHTDTRNKTIDVLNKKMKNTFTPKGVDVFEAYSSRIIIKRLAERGVIKYNPEEMLNNLYKAGYTRVIVQPTTIINGVEMESIEKNIAESSKLFKDIRLSTPLLYTPEDYDQLITILTKDINPNQSYLFIGHGTYDPSTAQYAMLDYMFKSKQYDNCVVGTIEGYPSIEHAKKQLKALNNKVVTLIPLMFVAGEHAKNDIATDWKDDITKEGYSVNIDLKGLGEHDNILNLYVSKALFMMEHKKREILDKKKLYQTTGEVLE